MSINFENKKINKISLSLSLSPLPSRPRFVSTIVGHDPEARGFTRSHE